MSESDSKGVRRFNQGEYTIPLRVPDGMPYKLGTTSEQIKAALEEGFAVFGEGCDGRVFVWPVGSGYEADHFFLGPATPHHFESIDEAADFAAGLCES